MKSFKDLCTPSAVYLALSLVSMALLIFQNMGNQRELCVGNFECNVESTTMVFVVKVLYVMFWTWVLDLICKSGHTKIAWFLLLLPFVLMFILIGLYMLNQGARLL